MRVEKGKGSGGGLGGHIERDEKMEHTFQHADKILSDQNKNFAVLDGKREMIVPEAIAFRIKQGYTKTKKNSDELKPIRKDAIKYMKHVFSGSHERMVEIADDPKLLDQWIKANVEYLKQEFGSAKNIIRLILHLDEKTPHLHVITVPLTDDGRLSAKEMMGKASDMRRRQTVYAEFMKPFGLERGVEGSRATHENQQQYNSRMERAHSRASKSVPETSKLVTAPDKNKMIDLLRNDLVVTREALEMELKAKEARKREAEAAKKKLEESKKETKRLEDYFMKQKKFMNDPDMLKAQLQILNEEKQRRDEKLAKLEELNEGYGKKKEETNQIKPRQIKR